MAMQKFDLEDRLLEYACLIVRLVEKLPNTRTGNHVAGQLLRSGTSALPNHGEAEGAESRSDFIHKLGVCYKELRETDRWLKLIQRIPLLTESTELETALRETDELVRIFAASIRTARARGNDGKLCREEMEPYRVEEKENA
jgi:four helix bundle protein